MGISFSNIHMPGWTSRGLPESEMPCEASWAIDDDTFSKTNKNLIYVRCGKYVLG